MTPETSADGQLAANPGEGCASAFFYGTLMAPEVFFTVCYGTKDVGPNVAKRHSFRPAILHGYCRRRVQYADYPGIVADAEHVVRGNLVTGLSAANLQLLDFFEGSEYVRKTLPVRLLSQVGDDKGVGNVEGEQCTAYVYVYLKRHQLETNEWDFEEFRRDKLQKWTRAGFVFEDCDPEQSATVAEQEAALDVEESAV